MRHELITTVDETELGPEAAEQGDNQAVIDELTTAGAKLGFIDDKTPTELATLLNGAAS